jgi:hypothetical protein
MKNRKVERMRNNNINNQNEEMELLKDELESRGSAAMLNEILEEISLEMIEDLLYEEEENNNINNQGNATNNNVNNQSNENNNIETINLKSNDGVKNRPDYIGAEQEQEIIDAMVEVNGFDKQTEVFTEEVAELLQAISKLRRVTFDLSTKALREKHKQLTKGEEEAILKQSLLVTNDTLLNEKDADEMLDAINAELKLRKEEEEIIETQLRAIINSLILLENKKKIDLSALKGLDKSNEILRQKQQQAQMQRLRVEVERLKALKETKTTRIEKLVKMKTSIEKEKAVSNVYEELAQVEFQIKLLLPYLNQAKLDAARQYNLTKINNKVVKPYKAEQVAKSQGEEVQG